MLGVHQKFLLMLLIFIDNTALNIRQRLDCVNQTHLVLASGKLVLPKMIYLTTRELHQDQGRQQGLSGAWWDPGLLQATPSQRNPQSGDPASL